MNRIKILTNFLSFFLAFSFSLLIFIGCSSGEEEYAPASYQGEIFSIEVFPIKEQYFSEPYGITYVTEYENVLIRGSLLNLVGPIDGLCMDVAYDPNITVTWKNLTNLESGTGAMYWRTECGFTCDCMPRVSVDASLSQGENLIQITAKREDGVYVQTIVEILKIGPGIPKDVTATPDDGKITVEWTDAADAITYNLYWSSIAQVGWDNMTKITNVTSPFVHDGLTNGQSYHYLITAENLEGESPPDHYVSTTAGWTITVLDSSISFSDHNEVEMVIDDNDVLHAISSFIDTATNNTITKYLTNPDGVWQEDILIKEQAENQDAAIVEDHNNIFHVTHADQGGLTHSYYSSGLFNEELVWPNASCSSSVTIDSNNFVHIVFHSGETYYSTNKSGSWHTSMIDSTIVDCPDHTRSSIATDYSDYVYVTGIIHEDDLFTFDNSSGEFVGKEWVLDASTFGVDLYQYSPDTFPGLYTIYETGGSLYYTSKRATGGSTSDPVNVFNGNNDTVPALKVKSGVHALSVCSSLYLCYAEPIFDTHWSRLYLDTIDVGLYYRSPVLEIDSNGKAHILVFKQTKEDVNLLYLREL